MSPKIYFSNPIAQYKSYEHDINEAILRVCTQGPYVLGPEVASFERDFAAYHGINYCAGVGSGTDALSLALRAFGIGEGDEVITVSHTALATVAAIVMTGATPVLVDIDEASYTIDPSKLEAALSPKTKAIIPVHLYGHPCDMDSILTFAKEYNLIVIEDCAQAHGALYNGKKVGTMGDAGCFSFYPTKNLGAIGDGGGVITRNSMAFEHIKRMRQYGWDTQRISQEIGVVSRLDEIQAAILNIKLPHLDADNEKRRTLAKTYDALLEKSDVITPRVASHNQHVYHLYVIRSRNRDTLKKDLSAIGIEAGIHYTHPAHKHPGYQNKIRISPQGLSVTEKIVDEILSLPIYPELDINTLHNLGRIFDVRQKAI